MAFSQPVQVKAVTTGVVTLNNRSPFLVDQQVFLEAEAGSTVYGAKHPGTGDVTKYQRISGIALNADTSLTVSTDLNAMHDLGTAITDATRLRVIAVKNGTPLVRVANDANAGAGEFQQTDTTTLEFGDALVASDVVELFVLDEDDIITVVSGGTAGRIYEKPCYTFMTASALTNMTVAAPIR